MARLSFSSMTPRPDRPIPGSLAIIASTLLLGALALGPVLYFSVRGGLSGVVLAALPLCLVVLWTWRPVGRNHAGSCLAFTLAMAAPLAAVLASQAWHHDWLPRELEAPLRFLLASAALLALIRVPHDPRRWLGTGFALAATCALLVILRVPSLTEGSYWLNRIHFGNAALAVALMSLMSIDWGDRDSAWMKALKLTGFSAGIFASILSLSRGGWLSLLFVAGVVLLFRQGSHWRRLTAGVAIIAGCLTLYAVSPQIQQRFELIHQDLVGYAHGNVDTSIGIRLQHWNAAWRLFADAPVFGAGPHGQRAELSRLAAEGLLTPEAASFAELHSQPLAYASAYGGVGLAALLAMHLVPVFLLARLTRSPEPRCRTSAWLAICWSLLFMGFGLTQEVFSLKSTASLYAFWMAALTAMALRDASRAAAAQAERQ